MAIIDFRFMRFLLFYLFITILMFSIAYCLYEDQIGLFDWRKSYVGKLNFVHFDGSAVNKRITVSSEQNVLAAINSRTGNLIWRRVLEKSRNTVDKILHLSDKLVSLSGGGKYLRFWDPNGNIIWENVLNNSLYHDRNNLASGLKSVDLVFSEKYPKNIYVMVGNWIKAFSLGTGKEIWSNELSSKIFGLVAHNHDIFSLEILGNGNSEIVVTKYNMDSGKQKDQVTFVAPWLFSQKTSCVFVGLALICAELKERIIYTLSLEGNEKDVKSQQIMSSTFDYETISEISMVVLHSSSVKHFCQEFVLRLKEKHSILLRLEKDNSITQLKEYHQEMLFHASSFGDDYLMLSLSFNESKILEVKCFNLSSMDELDTIQQTFSNENFHGKPVKFYSHFFSRKDNSIGYKLLVVFEDHAVVMLQHNGRTLWIREESLATITAAEMVELPVSPQQANFEALQKEFGHHHDGKIFSMFSQRIKAQFQQLQAFLASLNIDNDDGDNVKNGKGEDLTRDQFDLRKIIIVVTASGKLFGLDTIDGSIIWRRFIPDMLPFQHSAKSLLYVQRSVAHFPLSAQCIVLGRANRGSRLFIFNPSTGEPIDPNMPTGLNLPYHILQTMLLPYHDEKFSKILLIADTHLNVHLFPPNTKSVIQNTMKSIFLHVAADAQLTGYVVNINNLKLEEVWKIKLLSSEHVIDQVVFKRANEHVHSPGRVLGDRQVLYKYLNPNLMAVITKSPQETKPFIHVLLIDSVTGSIVHHGRHRNAQGPVHVIHSENWIIYKYLNTKSRRHELAVIELYEGYHERNSTAFSSFDPPISPMVLQQSYIFPLNVETMATSITNGGITKKTLLIGVSLGYVYSLPKSLLDPRRNFTDSMKLREEGLLPYIPELPIIETSFINYNQTVSNIRGIYTSSAGLESTCLVFVYGLDLYFTRVTPSRLFDVLKEDFDYLFITVTLVILALATFVSSRLASVKILRQLWR